MFDEKTAEEKRTVEDVKCDSVYKHTIQTQQNIARNCDQIRNNTKNTKHRMKHLRFHQLKEFF